MTCAASPAPDPDAPDDDEADDASALPPGWRSLAIEPPKPDEPPASNVHSIKGDAIWNRE